jgi:hypothetical protein
MAKKLKLFTDRAFLPKRQRYIPLLYPFWGSLEERHIDSDRFVDYCAVGMSIFQITSLQESDALLLPGEYVSGSPEALAMAELAKTHGKKLIVFFNSDSDEEIPLDNAIIFRTSFYASRRKPNEFAVPGWSNDFLKSHLQGQMRLRDKHEIPVIGYTGYVDYYHFLSYLAYFIRRVKKFGKDHFGADLRGRATRLISKSPLVKTKFMIRNISGSGIGKYYSAEKNEVFRNEYVHNIIDSDYTLVARGGGNFSYRLYEVLSCGRIPVFVNTDCVLPFDHIIDWKDYMIWIEAHDIELIALRISEFHAKLSNEEFHHLQIKARQLYEKWISPKGFYSNIHECLPC